MVGWKKAAVTGSISAATILFMKKRYPAGVLCTGVGLALLASEYPEKFEKVRRALPDYFDRGMRIMEMAQKADVVIYAISTNISRVESDGDKVLKYLTLETGGQAFFPFKVEDLEQSFENIANELRHQYNLFYRPEPLKTDGLYHTVNVKVKGRKDLVVRVRKGYYAPRL